MERYQWVLNGKEWQITSSNGLSFTIADNIGMYYLSQLLTNQKQKILYSNLISQGKCKEPDIKFEDSHDMLMLKYGFHENSWYSPIPKADSITIKDVAKQILIIQNQIYELESYHDYGALEERAEELEKLQKYLKSIYSQKKRVRVFRVDEIQMFYSVKKALQYVMKKIKAKDQHLVSYLTSIIHLHKDYNEMEEHKEMEVIIKK